MEEGRKQGPLASSWETYVRIAMAEKELKVRIPERK